MKEQVKCFFGNQYGWLIIPLIIAGLLLVLIGRTVEIADRITDWIVEKL